MNEPEAHFLSSEAATALDLPEGPVDMKNFLARASEKAEALPMPANFTFHWLGITFACRAQETDDGARIRMFAELGHIPYSAESRIDRLRTMTLLKLSGHIADGDFVTGPRQTLLFRSEFVLPLPLNGSTLMGSISAHLLKVKPYLELGLDLHNEEVDVDDEGNNT
ncbi:MAG: hypothetical protein QF797_10395 [Alphaproteobacteria bacterium]|jgi:hypothetical protein|nr:hypothetical protein [Rhodospirillaceae bacterium]MDP6405607.1 hypothetical protein [Alphaproteobacteria bacterium]MDP6623998.1 hypothetical protein [Alphaproteobacteria bacterium]|tara:strand:- start:306 stop:803 length:498 start_codon:yes stop_codon:yes gene_type:complete